MVGSSFHHSLGRGFLNPTRTSNQSVTKIQTLELKELAPRLTRKPNLRVGPIQGKDKIMPSLKEIYDLAVESNGEDSSVAKAIKRQMENERANRGRSFQELFYDEIGPKLQEINKS